MNLELGGPGPACSAMRVRRLLAGELTGVDKERTEAHIAGCARCLSVREEIAAEREALRRDGPFPQFAAGVAERLARVPRRRNWMPLAAAAALALMAGGVLVLRPADTETVRSKGAPSVQIFVQDARGVHELLRSEPVGQGAKLLVALHPAGRKHAEVSVVEPSESSVIYTGPAKEGPLPQAFEWTGSEKATLRVVFDGEGVEVPLHR